jgi:hypothetical protein
LRVGVRTLSADLALSQELGAAPTQIGEELVKVSGEAIEVADSSRPAVPISAATGRRAAMP